MRPIILIVSLIFFQPTPTAEVWDIWQRGQAVISPALVTYVNIRNAPNLQGALVGRVYRGDIDYNPQGDVEGWLRVRQNGATGWVSGVYVRVELQSTATPVITPTAPHQTATPAATVTPQSTATATISQETLARLRALELLRQAEQLEWHAAALRLEAVALLEGMLCC